jgi:hypothetical protein
MRRYTAAQLRNFPLELVRRKLQTFQWQTQRVCGSEGGDACQRDILSAQKTGRVGTGQSADRRQIE